MSNLERVSIIMMDRNDKELALGIATLLGAAPYLLDTEEYINDVAALLKIYSDDDHPRLIEALRHFDQVWLAKVMLDEGQDTRETINFIFPLTDLRDINHIASEVGPERCLYLYTEALPINFPLCRYLWLPGPEGRLEQFEREVNKSFAAISEPQSELR